MPSRRSLRRRRDFFDGGVAVTSTGCSGAGFAAAGGDGDAFGTSWMSFRSLGLILGASLENIMEAKETLETLSCEERIDWL